MIVVHLSGIKRLHNPFRERFLPLDGGTFLLGEGSVFMVIGLCHTVICHKMSRLPLED